MNIQQDIADAKKQFEDAFGPGMPPTSLVVGAKIPQSAVEDAEAAGLRCGRSIDECHMSAIDRAILRWFRSGEEKCGKPVEASTNRVAFSVAPGLAEGDWTKHTRRALVRLERANLVESRLDKEHGNRVRVWSLVRVPA